jgi:oligopeptidase B
VAKLRALKTDVNLLLLNTNMEAGHGGASGRFEEL